nr:MAG TPA: hypothetical protein [Caudoviricetes sp.]
MPTRRVPTGRTSIFCESNGKVREVNIYRHKWRAKRHLKTLRDAGVDAWLVPEMNTIFDD